METELELLLGNRCATANNNFSSGCAVAAQVVIIVTVVAILIATVLFHSRLPPERRAANFGGQAPQRQAQWNDGLREPVGQHLGRDFRDVISCNVLL